jgi:hypothetical protein
LHAALAGLWPALLLMFAPTAVLRSQSGKVGRMWLYLGLLGVAWGILLCAGWEIAWRIFPHWWPYASSLPLMPALAVLCLLLLTPLRRPIVALVDLGGRGRRGDRAVLAAALACVLALGLLNVLPYQREPKWLWYWVAWIRPLEEARVLLLMPLWGAWAMMVPAHFAPPAANAPPLVLAHLRDHPVAATAVWMAIPLAGTLWELSFLWGWVAIPAVMAMLAGSVGGILCCRLTGGASAATLRACNGMTQLAFFAGYLIAKSNT